MTKQVSFFIFLILVSIKSFASSSEVDSMRLRPSYTEIYSKCSSNTDDFRESMYIRSYQNGIKSIITTISSTEEAKVLFNASGITKDTYFLLNNPTTHVALKDCFKDDKLEYSFIRNILFFESVGKLVGIALVGTSIKLISSLIHKVFSSFFHLTNLQIKAINYSSMLLIGINEFKKHYTPQNIPKNQTDSKIILETNIHNKSVIEVESIRIKLNNPNISIEEKQQLQILLSNWELISEQFKPAM